jgi:C4-dicarboxylate transporter DctM subunit
MEAFAVFAVFVMALLAFLATGVPVAVATGLIGIIGTVLFISPFAVSHLATIAYSQSSYFVLTVVPLFILMGEALAATGIGSDLFRAAQLWLRRVPGALAVGTVFACSGFSAVCGSSPVTAATIGSMAVPEMVRLGYDRRLALGATAAGGTLGILIPPSIAMILYGVITETSIGALFMAGLLPGIMMAALLSLTIILIVLRRPETAPKLTGTVSRAERWRALRAVVPVLMLAFLVLGSIYFGVATPTEAGAVGAAGALAIAAASRALSIETIGRILGNTVRTTAMFMLLLIGGLFSAYVLARMGVPQGMANLLIGLDIPPWLIVVLINLLLMVLGMFLDPMSVLVIMVPIFFPAILAMGYDPVWFGVLVTINIEIAAISPPVGFNLFVLKSVIPDTDLVDVIRGSMIFIVPLALGILLLIAFPEIALFLPSLLR